MARIAFRLLCIAMISTAVVRLLLPVPPAPAPASRMEPEPVKVPQLQAPATALANAATAPAEQGPPPAPDPARVQAAKAAKAAREGRSSALSLSKGMEIRDRFARFYRQFGFSPRQILAFEEALAPLYTKVVVMDALASKDVLTEEEEASWRSFNEVVSTSMSDAMGGGPAMTTALSSYLISNEMNSLAGNIAASAVYAGASMSAADADKINAVLTEIVSGSDPLDRPNFRNLSVESVMERLGPSITPEQQELVRLSIQRWRFSQSYREATGSGNRPATRRL